MNPGALQNLDQLEADRRGAADNLRANSKLTVGEYCMPVAVVLGVIYLAAHHAFVLPCPVTAAKASASLTSHAAGDVAA